MLKGKTIEEAKQIKDKEIAEALELPPIKLHCSVLAEEGIKKAIENASKHGRQYVYMNFDRDEFKANFNGLGTPAQFQRLWLTELCNPNSKYLDGSSWNSTVGRENNQISNRDTQYSMSQIKSFPGTQYYQESFRGSVFDPPPVKKDSFQGLNFDVWNNANFNRAWETQ